jgi:hypothetical protein
VAAHLGGAGFAVLYWHLQWRILQVGRTFFAKARREPRPRLRIARDDLPVVAANAQPRAIDPSLASRADAILEKISRHGKESLTDEERDILQRASEEYRKRKK